MKAKVQRPPGSSQAPDDDARPTPTAREAVDRRRAVDGARLGVSAGVVAALEVESLVARVKGEPLSPLARKLARPADGRRVAFALLAAKLETVALRVPRDRGEGREQGLRDLIRALFLGTCGRSALAPLVATPARVDGRITLGAFDAPTTTKLRATWARLLDDDRRDGAVLLRAALRLLGASKPQLDEASREPRLR